MQALSVQVVASERARRTMAEVNQPGQPNVTLKNSLRPTMKAELQKYREDLATLGRRVIEMQSTKASRAEIEKELRSRFGFEDFHIQAALAGMLAELR
jgi:hypothetical protein